MSAARADLIDHLAAKFGAQAAVHSVTFMRNTRTGMWAGRCSGCGWMTVGRRDEVQALASAHDLEWEIVA